MKLIGKLKSDVESAPTKEEKKEAIEKAGMLLTDDELDQVAGGASVRSCEYNPCCPVSFRSPECINCLYRKNYINSPWGV